MSALPLPLPRVNPTQYCFGTGPIRPLTREEERTAPFEVRLRSIWPYLVRCVRKFLAGLSASERQSVDADDLMNEVALALCKKDAGFNPARGRYITFADQVCRTTLLSARPRMRTVHAPSNVAGRLDSYRTRAAAGTLSPEQDVIRRRMEQVMGPIDAFNADVLADHQLQTEADAVSSAASRREETVLADRTLRAALARVGPLHALVLTRLLGLFGAPPESPRQLVATLRAVGHHHHYTAARVQQIAAQAMTALQESASVTPTRGTSHDRREPAHPLHGL